MRTFSIAILLLLISSNAYSYSIKDTLISAIQVYLKHTVKDIIITYNSKLKSIELLEPYIISIDNISIDKNTFAFKGDIKLEANPLNIEATEIFGTFVANVDLPCASANIGFQEVLQEGGIELCNKNVNNIKDLENIYTSFEHIQGKKAMAKISKGALFKKSHLKSPEVIHKNEVVTVIYEGHELVLKAEAVALNDGAVGDIIKVKNERSGAIIYGKVQSENLVQVTNSD